MAGKKDPSIYDDRSNIGSSDELDEYGVWVKTEPQDLSSSLPEMEELPDFNGSDGDDLDLPELSDFSSLEPETDGLNPPDSDIFDISDDDLGIPQSESASTAPSDDFDDDDLPTRGPVEGPDLEFEELTDEVSLPETAVSGPSSSASGGGFDSVSVDDFLDSSPAPKSVDFGNLDEKLEGGSSKGGGMELSNQLLMKIADELSSIKKELASLKGGFTGVPGEIKTETSDSKEEPKSESKGGGFFDEEEDEKIALTGDELDNILHTANFTEEAGSDEGIDESLDESINEEISFSDDTDIISDSPQEDIISETSDISETPQVDVISEMPQEDIISETPDYITFDEADLAELGGEVQTESSMGTQDDFEAAVDMDIDMNASLPDFEEEPELNDLRETGAQPVTPPPEDTSYLEADPLAVPFDEQLDEQIDLSGAVIEEPDLSAHITENPVMEPELDNISIDVDMEEQPFIEEQASAMPSASDDFIYEAEETQEIPLSEGDMDFGDSALADERAEDGIPSNLKSELKTVLSYMDQLLESLPEEKIEEFARSEYFETYKKLFEDLGLA